MEDVYKRQSEYTVHASDCRCGRAGNASASVREMCIRDRAVPTDEEFPFVLDCATSITQRGKIEYFARSGKDTPAGMVIGQDGSAMTDSQRILTALTRGEAALAPLEMCIRDRNWSGS